MVWKLGVDVGGTFTDALLYNVSTGITYRAKTPTTPGDQSDGVLEAIDQIRKQLPQNEKTIWECVNHGSTIATNAILEGKGSKVALLVTEGYKQMLQIRRSKVPGGLAGWMIWPKPEPLAPLELTIEVPGRISSSGDIIRPFDEVALRQHLTPLKQDKPESICVSLINSFANFEHERKVKALLAEEFPDIPVSLSSEILPEVMEYERTLTTVVNAYVKPQVSRYLDSLQEQLGSTELRVLRSDWSIRVAANLLHSGVVATVVHQTGFKNLMTFDMGGTSTDVCLIENGVPELRRETTVGDLTASPPVAAATGALRVGPSSAGAVPGPACYSKGGKLPTVTDANVVLGYLPTSLLGGSFALSTEAAINAIEEHIAMPLGLSVRDAAEGIVKIANEKMYGSLRSVSVDKGKDPRDYQLVAFGDLLGSWPAIVPPSPGVLCAYGDACTALRHETSATVSKKLSEISVQEIVNICSELSAVAGRILMSQGLDSDAYSSTFQADLRFRGQALSLPVTFVMDDLKEKCERFKTMHHQLFTFSLEVEVEMINLRATCTGSIAKEAIIEETQIYYQGQEFTNVPASDSLNGPCLILEADSTTFIAPFHRAEIDASTTRDGDIPLSVNKVDQVVVELMEAALSNARNEMDALIQRYAHNFIPSTFPAMREQLDYFPQISAGDGPNYRPHGFIQGFLRSWKEPIKEGDVFITNDPYSCSAAISHLNDFLVINPVHYSGKLIAWTANLGHFTDIGSNVPGSMPIHSISIHDDGIQIPLCALYNAGTPNKAVFQIIEQNSRMPEFARGDLQALVAATKIAGKRMQELCHRFGLKIYEDALDELLRRNKLAVGTLIKQIPDKKIQFEDYIDDDGHGYGPWKVACSMVKEINELNEETLVFDFDGTDPQSDFSINFALSQEMLRMFVIIYLLTVWDPSTVVNDGAYDLIQTKIPRGTILNPIHPAALSGRTHLLGRLFDVIGAIFSSLNPDFAAAAGFSDSPHLFYSGWSSAGEWFQLYQIGFGGIPARVIGDGPDGHSYV
ncbi:Hydantoinase/oxoprolinase-domain-containing protein [Flagelloscypha sp. PMI_526]|nr:Hydantoinase/oxoprolinase-domain-containing protein [Flagelloscypha sp. PMI_526]